MSTVTVAALRSPIPPTQAEVQATAAVVAGWPAALDALETAELDGFVVTEDGTAHHFGAWTPNPSISLSSADRTP